MKRSEDRILTTHVGSLIRPPELLELSAGAKDGAGRQRYEDHLKQSVAAIVRMQAKAGIDVVNDGEFGKSGWANYALGRVSGFEERPKEMYPAVWLGRDRIRFADFMAKEFPRGVTGTPGHACVGPITYRDRDSIERDTRNLTAAVKSADVAEAFFTAVAPASVGYDAANEYYPNEADYVFAIADALREEYLAIIDAGLILQVDDAVLANMYDHLVQQSPQRYREWAELRIEATNRALAGHSGGPHPLSRLLRQLACSARRRRGTGGYRGPDPQGARRRLLDRSRQCAARARMAGVGEGKAAGGKDPDSGRGDTSHCNSRASAPGG